MCTSGSFQNNQRQVLQSLFIPVVESNYIGESDPKSRVVSDVVLVLLVLITVATMRYILHRINLKSFMREVKSDKIARADIPYNRSDVFDASTSDVNIPLTPRTARHAERGELYPFFQPYQYGSHIGAWPTSVIYAPTPKTPNYEYKPTNNYGYSKSLEYLDDASSSGHSSHTHTVSRPSVDDVSWETDSTAGYASTCISSPAFTSRGATYCRWKEASEASTVMDIPGGSDARWVRLSPPPGYTTTAQ
ncbi:hypothetical protein DFS33DRAFT_1387556 [Desarmillaria ectypa]|nr:hypothetical protein DFS33DRAFT_1387556 [Desarmillaria ectypa]